LFLRVSLTLAAAAAVAVLGPGCTVGPNYHRPQTAVPGQFAAPSRGAAGATTAPATAPTALVTTRPVEITQWWATLGDEQLNDLVRDAVASNHDLRLAAGRLREARARLAVAGGAQWPSVDGKASHNRQRLSETAQPFASVQPGVLPFEFDLWQLGFDASWELDVFGGTRRALQAAGADVAAGVEDRRDVMVSVVAEVARNYVELRGTQRELEVTERSLASQRQTLEVTRNQQANGVATQFDVSRAAAQAAATEAELPAIENRQWQAIHRIAVLLGREPNALAKQLSERRPIPVPPAEVPVGVPSELLRRRPDIRRAERELAGATARVGVAVADLFPRFTLNGTLGVQSSETGDLFQWPSRYFNVGPAVTMPLFDAGRRRAVIALRQAQQEQALDRYEQSVLRALAETEDAVVALQTEQRRAASLRESVRSYEDAANLARELYVQGLTDFLGVLEAERSLYLQQDALARSERAVTTDLIVLYKALGGGWEVAFPDAAGAAAVSRQASR
jgi:NodT family efflux transporter outer membrane factor (OMF) lipoprotein